MFGRKRQTGHKPAKHRPPPLHLFYKAIEGVHRDKQATRRARVRGDERRIGHHGRIEDIHRHRDQSRSGAKHLPPCHKKHERQHQRKDTSSHVNTEQQSVRAVMPSVLRIVAKQQLPAAVVRLRLEVPALPWSDLQIEWQQRQRRHQLHQRRMLRVQAVFAVLPVHVAGIDVVALVPAGRLLPSRQPDLNNHHHQQEEHSSPDPPSPLHALTSSPR